jgi:hypothetical protein
MREIKALIGPATEHIKKLSPFKVSPELHG